MEDALLAVKPVLLALVRVLHEYHAVLRLRDQWQPSSWTGAPPTLQDWVLHQVRPSQRGSEVPFSRRTRWSQDMEERIKANADEEWDVYLCCAVLLGDLSYPDRGVLDHEPDVRDRVQRVFTTRNLWAHQKPYYTGPAFIDECTRAFREYVEVQRAAHEDVKRDRAQRQAAFEAQRQAEEARRREEEAQRQEERRRRQQEEESRRESEREEARRVEEDVARRRQEQEREAREQTLWFRAMSWFREKIL